MATKITKQFHIHNARQFIESLDEQANSLYYIAAGRHLPWPTAGDPEVLASLARNGLDLPS